jgi:cytochrome c oxidase subunit 3
VLYMFLTLLVEGYLYQAWEWKNFKRWVILTKGGSLLQFVDKEGHRVALADFAVNLHEEREQLTQIRQSGLWAKVLYLVFWSSGFKSHPDILIRTEVLPKSKTILSRKESELRLSDARYVVEGANLKRNEYGSKLFADFFSPDFMDFTFFQV